MKKVLISLLVLCFALVLYVFDTFYIVENNLSDRFMNDTRSTDYRIKILAIDEASLQDIGRWPWKRDIVASVVEELVNNNVDAVWTDVLYNETSETKADDEYWQRLIEEHDNIILPLYFEFPSRQNVRDGIKLKTVQKPIYTIDSSQLGHINVMENQDRIVRSVMLGIEDDNNIVPAISVVLANRLLNDDNQVQADESGNWYRGDTPMPTGNTQNLNFNYASSPDDPKFDVISIKDVIGGDVPYSYFSNSVVLIGPYATGLQDDFNTPMSNTTTMYGVEIHANIIQSLLDESYYEEISLPIGVAIIILVFLLVTAVFRWVRPKWATILLVLFLILYTLIVFEVFSYFNILLPFIYPLIAIIFAYLSSIIFQYIQESLERRRVTNVFGRYVSKNIVREILAGGDEISLGGERKDVTLMFVDIRGFTSLSEKMEPEQVIKILNEYLELCTIAIFESEGTIDKFMGDGVMTIFGAPVEQSDHAERALKSALRMKELSTDLYKRLLKQYGQSVHFGIGIHTGFAVIGNVGSKDRLDYTAIGDTVNLAARLESNAKPSQILISSDTYERVKHQFVCKKLPPIQVKGKQDPVTVYQVENEVDHDI